MKVKFKRFHEDAKIPTKAYRGDFCYDVYAVTEEEIAPNVWKYGLGFGLQIESGKEELLKNIFVNIENAPPKSKYRLTPSFFGMENRHGLEQMHRNDR